MLSTKSKYNQLVAKYSENKKSVWGKNATSPAANLTSEIVTLILEEAILNRVSDIHIEPRTDKVLVRYRVDGTLLDALEIPLNTEINIVPRLKILAGIPSDAVNSRKAWDGRFTADIKDRKFDFRVATFPTILGEKIALRILSKDTGIVDLRKIGMTAADLTRLEPVIERKSGLILVSGPTGSGKTTTLYSLLRRLQTPGVNIVTLEDPVEYQIDGVNQCNLQQKGKDDEDFLSGLKAILRQDPDIVLIGEIRDEQSAEIALRASITGHLVLSSLHANSAIGTVVRLINMGLERHTVAYALTATVAQRLVRRICEGCRKPYHLEPRALEALCLKYGLNAKLFMPASAPKAGSDTGMHYLSSEEGAAQEIIFYQGKGCAMCSGTGYLGRMGIFEVLRITDPMREAIVNKASATDLEQIAVQDGFQSMALDAIQKAKKGLVTLDEIYPILLEKSS